jgi:hypothetical protein
MGIKPMVVTGLIYALGEHYLKIYKVLSWNGWLSPILSSFSLHFGTIRPWQLQFPLSNLLRGKIVELKIKF